MADVVVLVAAQAGEYRDHEATAPWTRPENEFVAPWGMFTAAEFALIARRHMHVYGTTREQLSIVAATIRNNGSRNPEAVYYDRGPFTPGRHHRVPAHRRPVPSARLRDHVGRRMRAGRGQHRAVDVARPADLRAGQRRGLPRPVLSAPAGVGPHRAARRSTPTAWSGGALPTCAFAHAGTAAATTSTCWNSTTRSRSKSSGSWRLSASAATARAARSSPTATSPSTAATPSRPTAEPCRSATPAPIRR